MTIPGGMAVMSVAEAWLRRFVLMAVIASTVGGTAAGNDASDTVWRDARRLTAWIDDHLEACWQRDGIVASKPASDAEWLRRVYLDLAGVIPPVWEVRAFLADGDPERYERVVDGLLQSPAHASHLATVWRKALLPEADANPNLRFTVPGTQQWLRNQFAAGRPYDAIVREILTDEISGAGSPRNLYDPRGPVSPAGFYAVKGSRPENLAAGTARLFMGIRLECAQCHDHPFADWKREQFWQLAAFYGSLKRQDETNDFSLVEEDKSVRQITIAGTEQVVPALYLDGAEPDWDDGADGPRATLAAWLTSAENPYFARATVNRLWAMMFGRGLVEPVDDFDPSNAPSHPELLEKLAAEFASHEFDLHLVMRALATSRAYRLSSAVSDESQDDPRAFAVMPVRGLAPEQLFDSLARAIAVPSEGGGPAAYLNVASVRGHFLETFRDQAESPIDYQTSIIQALALINGSTVAQATGMENSRTLAAVINYPGMETTEQIATLYLATLSRPPRGVELLRLVAYVEKGGPSGDKNRALADVFWALLNSSEFVFNH